VINAADFDQIINVVDKGCHIGLGILRINRGPRFLKAGDKALITTNSQKVRSFNPNFSTRCWQVPAQPLETSELCMQA
jgi:hypothetical protein